MQEKIVLVLIVILASLIRVSFLGEVPPSPNWDEVALGYNAYSMLHTGRDEYGKLFPLILRSYDDFKPAVYMYFVIPSILLFGLNTFAVRFPAVIFAILAVLAVYFLVKELLGKETISIGKKSVSSSSLALLSSLLLAISPWHIQFSRIAFESNVGVAFNIFAALFFLKGLKKPVWLLLSAFCFGINPSIYQSDKVFTPLLCLIFLMSYWKQLLRVRTKYLLLAVIVGFITIFPVAYYHATDKQSFARASGVSIFSDQTSFLRDVSQRVMVDRQRSDPVGMIFDNRRVAFVKAIIAGYLSHFDLNWLFVHGDIPRHHAPFMGLLYLFELPFVLIGIYQLMFGKFDRRIKFVLFLWLLIAPIPASITSGVPHAVRTLNFLPTFQIFSAIGIATAYVFISQMRYLLRVGIFGIFFSIAVFNISYFFNQYFLQQNYYTSIDWQYGYKQAIEKVKEIDRDYRKVVVTNKPPLDQSYMFFLFYLRYPPQLYLNDSSRNGSGGFRENHAFGKYEFRPIEWENEEKASDILYVGRPEDFPEGGKIIKTVKYINGVDAIEVVSVK